MIRRDRLMARTRRPYEPVCGKLLVAVNAGEVDKLATLKAQAQANGVADLIWLSRKEVRALEPALVLFSLSGALPSHASSIQFPLQAALACILRSISLGRPNLARRRMGGRNRLQRRSSASAVLLRRDPNLLAGPAGGRPAARLRRRQAEDRPARRLDHRFPPADRKGTRRCGVNQPVRD
jgi:hypothetical protein